MKQIKIACKAAATAPLDDFVWFQDDLKFLSDDDYQKLKNEIVLHGFSDALTVWIDPDMNLKLLDGHQRVLTLKRMRDEEDFHIPFIPYSVTEADSEKQAKEKLLSITGAYGKFSPMGVSRFLNSIDLPAMEAMGRFSLPGLDFETLPMLKEVEVSAHERTVGGDAKDGAKEIDSDSFSDFAHTCPKCGFEFGEK